MARTRKNTNRIKELRSAKGWDAKELAARAGIWQAQLYEYENGYNTPGYANLRAIADALGCSIEDLDLAMLEPEAEAAT